MTTYNFDQLTSDLKPSWKALLNEVKQEIPEKIKELENKLNDDYKIYKGAVPIYPPINNIFEAFKHFEVNDTKIVILGQDPYHGKGQAHGLSFSVQDGIAIPPSLRNIFIELQKEYADFTPPKSGNLTKWLNQGVLLLNSALTVLQGNPNEYQYEWTPITNLIIKKLSEKHPGGIVFILWGNDAKKKADKKKGVIDINKHHTLTSVHPSPLSASRGFFGCNHFKEANKILLKNNKSEIDWHLT